MNGPVDPGQSEAVQQARARANRIAQAFATVFGQSTRRSEAQSLVLQHLESCAGDDQNAYRFNDARDGVALIAAGIHRDGARSLLRVIERQLSIAHANASSESSAKKAKTKTVR